MGARLEELDWRTTPMGELSLRRRRDPVSGADVYEVLLADEYLMSSMFTAAERELAHRALARLPDGPLDVMVGGLGLGYTAAAVLEHPSVRSLTVIEALAEVVEWHERELVPAAATLTADARCRLVHADFFALLDAAPEQRCHAILVDIDHSPQHLLRPAHGRFYQSRGLQQVASWLHPGGVFGLWSNDPPDGDFTTALATAFADVAAETVDFPNPLQDGRASNTVYLARAR